MNALTALGCFVLAAAVGGLIGAVPALGISYYFAGPAAEQAAAAAGLIAALVSGVAVFQWARRLSLAKKPE